jgi:hypothetical protein
MPNRFPIANGNWSDPTIWNAGLGLPTSSDMVFANNKIVTIDQNINVLGLSGTSTTGISASGYFIASDGISIKANLTSSNSPITTFSVSPLILSNGTTAVNPTLVLTGSMNVSLTGSITQGVSGCITIVHMGTGTLNILGSTLDYGSVAGGSYNNGQILIYTGSVNIIGNATTAGSTGTPGIWNWFGRLNIVGNLQAKLNQVATTIYSICVLNEYGTVNLTGNITATSINQAAYSAHGIQNNAGTVNITGNLFSSGSNAPCVANASALAITNITGNVTAGTTAAALSNGATGGIISCIGQVNASTTAGAYFSSGTTATNIFSGPFINSGSRNAVYCYNIQLYNNVTTRYTIGVSGSSSTITLSSADQYTGLPILTDVRFGVAYGPGNSVTGSMRVPDSRSVSFGVPVDQTVGATLAKPEDLWNIATTSLTASNSIGQRLASTLSSASMAAIVNAFG